MTASSEDIKKLREQTGAGILDCKKALVETKGDFDKAVEFLRKKGLAAAASRVGRVASEGVVAVCVQENKGAIVEINSETDFVARNKDFQSVVEDIVMLACEKQPGYESLLELTIPKRNMTVKEAVADLVGSIKENIQVRRIATVSVSEGVVAKYIHNAIGAHHGKIGVLIGIESSLSDHEALTDLGKKIAMHIAATKPKSLTVEELSKEAIQKEKEIYAAQARSSGKPEAVIEKMIEGRIRKFYEEVVLLEQNFILDTKITVKDYIAQEAKRLGTDVTIKGYVYFVLGEGIEKVEKDFASEVQEQLNQ